MMAKHMPDDMRALGLAMHEQASKFAQEAGKIKQGGDMRSALAELSQVMQACNACGSAYRLEQTGGRLRSPSCASRPGTSTRSASA